MAESVQSDSVDAQPGAIVRYLTSCVSARMLVHGVVVQMAAVMLTSIASTLVPDGSPADLEPIHRLMLAAPLIDLSANIISLAGWALVIFACGKVVAESVRGGER